MKLTREEREGTAKPFLKWPGGKRWLAPVLAKVLPATVQSTYFEPFVGAAAAFFFLRPNRANLSDINGDLIVCLSEIKLHPYRVLEVLDKLENSPECFYRVRDWQPKRAHERAARMIFLSKTAWGGMYRVNRNGEFNAPYAYHSRKIFDETEILRASRALRLARIECADFESAITRARRGDVVYADPPYATLIKEDLFCRYSADPFSWDDQRRLAASLHDASRRGVTVVVSAPPKREIFSLYKGWARMQVRRPRNVSLVVRRKLPIAEVLLTNVPRLFGDLSYP